MSHRGEKRFRPRRPGIFAKFAIALLSLDFIPFAVFSVGMFLAFQENLARFSMANFERLLEYHAGTVDSIARGYDEVTQLVYSYRTGTANGLADFIGPGTRADSLAVASKIEGCLEAILYSDPWIQAATLVEDDGKVFQVTRRNKELRVGFDYRSLSWFERIRASGKKLVVVPPRPDSAYAKSGSSVVTFARNYYDLSTLPSRDGEITPAIILVDVDPAVFGRSLTGLDLGIQGSYSLVDRNGALFAGTAAGGKKAAGFYELSRPLEMRDWILSIRVSKRDLTAHSAGLLPYLIAGTVFCALAIVVFAILFSRMFSRPLSGILRAFKKVESGDFSQRLPAGQDDEFGVLSRSFNTMSAELKDYIDREFVARIGRREAELDALRSRLKPHFLANTLEVIRMAAIDARDETAAEMIRALSSQLRYLLEEDFDEVSLDRELGMAADYYRLLSLRKDGGFALEMDVPEALRSVQVPKLTLQPLVENAMLHGLGPRQWKGMVRVTARIEGRDSDARLEICVYDDGVGMSPEKLAEIQKALGQSTAGTVQDARPAEVAQTASARFLGLSGVHFRLKLRYGQKAGLDIETAQGMGTVVRAIIPLGSRAEPEVPDAV